MGLQLLTEPGDIPNSITVGDLNNDGRQDIVTADSGTSVISVLLGSSSGGF
ncbi:MAG: FG-GAP repeat protein [Chloracidobacterium sp.]|nr:FG-GAP repeat protein [Chloracidobacterium sp.]